MIESKSADDTKLKQQYDRWNSEISSQNYRFDRIETEIKYLEEIEKEDVLSAFNKTILANQKTLIVAVEGAEPTSQSCQSDYELSEHVMPLGDAFHEFSPILDVTQFRKENKFFNYAYINKNT